MPDVVRAPYNDDEEGMYESGVGDGRGFVADGAYVGRPDIGPMMPASARTTIDPQVAYTAALKDRFLSAREQMHIAPDDGIRASWGEKHRNILKVNDNLGYANWHRLMSRTAPKPDQVRSMDVEYAENMLRIIREMSLVRDQQLPEKTSVWIWSLLARLDDVGTMDNEEVYEIRKLGKKAVLVQLSLHDPAAAAALEDASKEVPEQAIVAMDAKVNGEGKSDAADRPSLHAPVTDTPERQSTLATLDMIITIVGDVFGQRDLLEFRRPWEVAEQKAEIVPE